MLLTYSACLGYSESLLLLGICDPTMARLLERRCTSGGIYPGQFVMLGQDALTATPVADDTAPFDTVAIDVASKYQSTEHYLLSRVRHRIPPMAPLAQRCILLAEMIYRGAHYALAKPNCALVGRISNDSALEKPDCEVLLEEDPAARLYCVRVQRAPLEVALRWPRGITIFGRLVWSHMRLVELAEQFLSSFKHVRASTPALCRVAARRVHPFRWTEQELEDLQFVKGELLAIGDSEPRPAANPQRQVKDVHRAIYHTLPPEYADFDQAIKGSGYKRGGHTLRAMQDLVNWKCAERQPLKEGGGVRRGPNEL